MGIDPRPIEKTSGRETQHLMTQGEILALVADKLEIVNQQFAKDLQSDVAIVSGMGAHLSDGGGKRLRPALLLLSSGLVGYRGQLDVLYAVTLELIHTATLVHDDIIDEATMRRGRESLNRRWGNDLTVLMGDHLYIKAMQRAIEGGDLRILDLLARTTLSMIEGELIQRDQNGRLDVREGEHMAVVERKTAALFSACCRVPAILAGASQEQQEALARYGMDLGMAYQLVDDLLDFTADERTLGKPTVNDLPEGKLTLPLIYLLEKGDPDDAARLRQVMEDRGFVRVPRQPLLDLLRQSGCLERSREAALGFTRRARTHLSAFGAGPFKDSMHSVLEFVIERDR